MADSTVATLSTVIEVIVKNDKALPQLDERLKGVDKTSQRTSTSVEGLGRAQQKAANDALALARAEARTLTTKGDLTGAQSRLTQALDGSQATSLRVAGAQNQLAQIENRLSGESETLTQSFRRQNEEIAKLGQGGASGLDSLRGKLDSLKNGLSSIVGIAGSVAGALGLAFGAQELVKFGKEALTAAGGLEKAQATARAMSGSQERYNELLTLATAGQQKFGGSLEANISGLTSLVNTANRAGVSLGVLDDLSRRLAAVDPVQGIEGASFALKEFLSGDATSLAKRFELPKTEIQALAQSSASTTVKLKELDRLLADMGVSSEVVAAQSTTTAAAYDRLGAAADNAKVKIGAMLAEALKASAVKATGMLGEIGSGQGAANDAIQNGENYDAYLARLNAIDARIKAVTANDPIAEWITRQMAGIQPLPPELYKVALALQQTGLSGEQAAIRAQALTGFYSQLGLISQGLGNQSAQAKAGFDALIPTMLQLGSESSAAQQAVLGLVEEYANTGNLAAFQAGLQGLQVTQQENAALNLANADAVTVQAAATSAAVPPTLEQANALIQAAAAGQLYTDSQGNAIVATQEAADADAIATSAKELHNAQMELMQAQTQAAADSFLALNPNIDQSGVASAVAAGKISGAVGQIIALRLEIAAAQAKLASFQAQAGVNVAASPSTLKAGGLGRANAYLDAGDDSKIVQDRVKANVAAYNAQQNAAKELDAAERDRIRTVGTAAEKEALYRKELQEAEYQYGKNSAAAVRAQTALTQYEQAQAKSGKKGGGKGKKGGGAAKLSEQQKYDNKRTLEAMKTNDKLEDEETKHAKNVQKIIATNRKNIEKIEADSNKKRLKAQQDFADAQQAGQASMDRALFEMDDQDVAKKYSAEYYAGLSEVEKIAQEKGADVAQAYQQAYEETIKARAQREADINKARKDGASGDEIAAMQQLDAQDRAVEDRKLQRIKDSQDSIAAERQAALDEEAARTEQALADETARYEESTGKIATAAERSAERQMTAAQLARKEIDANTASLEKLAAGYDKVAAAGGTVGSTPSTSPDTTSATPSGASGDSGILERLGAIESAVRAIGADIVRAERDGAAKVAGAMSSRTPT